MKYLIQHRKQFAVTVAGFIMAVIALINAVKSGELNEDVIITVIFTGLAVLGWYYNNPTSEENDEATKQVRLAKRKEDLEDNYWNDYPSAEPVAEEGGENNGECNS